MKKKRTLQDVRESAMKLILEEEMKKQDKNLQESENNEELPKLSEKEINEVRELLAMLKEDDENCDCCAEEEQMEDLEKAPNFFSRINKTVLCISIVAITIACWLCFHHIVFGILFLVEVIIGCVFALYYTLSRKSVFFNTLSDGIKYIEPDENGKGLADLVMQEPVEELRDLLDYTNNPREFNRIGYRPDTRVLIIGETGYGKSALIKAFSNDTALPIIQVHASRFFETENVVEKLFQLSNEFPGMEYIIHIESFEKIIEHGTSITESPEVILDKLNTYLNIFPNVILFATCEDSSSLASNDEIYSSFFKKAIVLDTPEQEERVRLLEEFTSHLALSSDVHLDQIARNCYGSSIGELKYLVATTISIARKNKHAKIQMDDFYEAFDTLEFGKTGKKHSEESQKLAAYHESGHALVHYLLNGNKNLLRVISIGRGNAGGLTYFSPDSDKLVQTKEDLLNQICVMYGGRCAEKIVFDIISTGPSSDIQHATSLILSMIQRYGMSDTIGALNVSPKLAGLAIMNESPYMRNLISKECITISKECEERAMQLLKENCDKLDVLANYLMEHESITGEEMDELLKKV